MSKANQYPIGEIKTATDGVLMFAGQGRQVGRVLTKSLEWPTEEQGLRTRLVDMRITDKIGSLLIPGARVIGLEFEEEMATLMYLNPKSGKIKGIVRGADYDDLTANYEGHEYAGQNSGVFRPDQTDYEVLLRHLNYGLANPGLIHIDS